MFLTQTVPRQREIIEVVLRNGWDYMRTLLTGGKADQPQLPPPAVLRNIFGRFGTCLCQTWSTAFYPS